MAARQQTKVHKYGLFYFPLDETVAQCATSRIIDGKGRIRVGNMVRIKWDRNNPNVPAKILKLADTNLEITNAERDVDMSSIQLSKEDQAFVTDDKSNKDTEKPKSFGEICPAVKNVQKSTTTSVTELDSLSPNSEHLNRSTPTGVTPYPESENLRFTFDQTFPPSRPCSEMGFSVDLTLPGRMTNSPEPFPCKTSTHKDYREDIPKFNSNKLGEKLNSIQLNLGEINDSLAQLKDKVYENSNSIEQMICNQKDLMIKLDRFNTRVDNWSGERSTLALVRSTKFTHKNTAEAPLKLSTEKLVELKDMSKSKSNFAVVLLKTLFSKEERMGRSVFGKRKRKPGLCGVKLNQIKSYFFEVYPAATEEEEKSVWQQCVNSMNQHLKKYNKLDTSQDSSLDVSMEST